MKDPVESISYFCLVQLEILKSEELRLRKEIENCQIQKEFLASVLKDLSGKMPQNGDNPADLLDTIRSVKKT